MMNTTIHSPELSSRDEAVLPGPSLAVQILCVVEISVGTVMLFSPVALIFVSGVICCFGASGWLLVFGIIFSIAFLAGGLTLILDGQKRCKGRRDCDSQPPA
jgi:hypothetical protein